MTDVEQRATATHYETLLAPIYGWMLGDLVVARAGAATELARLGVGPAIGRRRALDLGAGLGLHAIPLAALGYEVTAIDSSATLLAELTRARPEVTTICADLLAVPAASAMTDPFDVIVCLGDTLTHLPSASAVDDLLDAARGWLAPDGTLAFRFRDYTHTRQGADRFFLVRGDDSRILTCCLDYEETRVAVTDILHERGDAGWRMRASTYHKLRLAGASIAAALKARGLSVARADVEGGWVTVVARGAAAPG